MLEISNITQIVGAVGVIISVLYLAMQIRQNTKMSQSETLQALTTRLCDRLLMVVSDKSLAELINLDWKSDELTQIQRVQINYWVTAVIADIRDIYHQYELKVIPFDVLVGRTKIMKKGMFQSEMGKKVWEHQKDSYEENFVAWFERVMEF